VKIVIESTTKVVELNGVPARVWEGGTETGIPVIVFVTRIAVARTEDTAEFERDLAEQRAPSPEVESWPARLVL